MLTDTHCHLFYDELKNDLSAVLERARELGVGRFICVATNIADSNECLQLSVAHENIYATAGIHPHDAKDAPKDFVDQIHELMNDDKMVAVGEMGLDYFRNLSDPEVQKKIFRAQMKIALDLNKPIIFHNRDADEDLVSILSEFPDVRGVAHCFSSTLEVAEKFMDLGYYISFSGNITFKNSHLPNVAKEIPLDRLLVETDCPYLSPDPYRGKTNEPARVRVVAEKLADIHCLPFEKIVEVTSNNATEVFKL
ncbi:MAG: TatD family hydrolase [Candidatus Marinimicrobia bacterium]|jgi:TatD DNase family protein|nr:TatD family hydrolase [Candidatus Neomarinimicrobiota bacterium]|tara:strand:+ start:3217 stop:3972 length:756 start_codon:yes stop_codon:yes gene_type:complete